MTWDLSRMTPKGRLRTTRLSETELEIMRAIAARKPRQEVADQRGVTRHTVRNQLANIYRKLDVRSRWEAVAKLDRTMPGWR